MIIQSFRSSFWLEEKHWFVEYHKYRLFSIPRFLPNPVDIFHWLDLYTTAPDRSFIFRHIIAVRTRSHVLGSGYYFPNVETLDVRCFIPVN